MLSVYSLFMRHSLHRIPLIPVSNNVCISLTCWPHTHIGWVACISNSLRVNIVPVSGSQTSDSEPETKTGNSDGRRTTRATFVTKEEAGGVPSEIITTDSDKPEVFQTKKSRNNFYQSISCSVLVYDNLASSCKCLCLEI